MFRPDPTEEGNGMVKEQKEDVTKCFKPKTVSVVEKKFHCGCPSLMNTPPDLNVNLTAIILIPFLEAKMFLIVRKVAPCDFPVILLRFSQDMMGNLGCFLGVGEDLLQSLRTYLVRGKRR